MARPKTESHTVSLRWRVSKGFEHQWNALSQKKREAFRQSKGKKNPPVRGAELPGFYYLDIYSNGQRETKRIGLLTTYDGAANDATERTARKVALNYSDETWRERHGFEGNLKGKITFLEFYRSLVPGRHKSWKSTALMLEDFPGRDTALAEIGYEWLRDVQEHLLAGVSQNSASTYYAKIKAALQIAVQRELIPSNPATKIKAIQQVPSQRTYLTLDELQILAKAPCEKPEVKRAFLFACFACGLRYSDIRALTWSKVQDGRLAFRVQKTNEPEWIDLPKFAVKLLGTRRDDNERLFALPPSEWDSWNCLQKWSKSAGLSKHVTFHVARHTFATMMLEQTGDIYLVSKLIGHASIQHTQLYAKLVDDRKRTAMMSLPEIELA